MYALAHAFITYKGINPPSSQNVFLLKPLPYESIIEIQKPSFPIYTLNQVSITSISISCDSSHILHAQFRCHITYTAKNLTHTTHSVFHIINIMEAIDPSHDTRPQIYTQDLYSYCLDSTHIYLFVLFSIPN